MQQAVEQDEIAEAVFGKNRLQVELEVRLATDEGRIAQQTERASVGDDAPQRLGAVEVFLNQGMRRKARPAGRC